MKSTIEIDCVPNGYEPVRFGHPKAGELFVDGNVFGCGRIVKEPTDCKLALRLIVRPVWQPPSWLKPGWISSNDGRDWFWYSEKPSYEAGRWLSAAKVRWIDPSYVDLAPPPFTDAESSLREIKGR